jgi:hypothetical protein
MSAPAFRGRPSAASRWPPWLRVHSGTARIDAGPYTGTMQLVPLTLVVVALCVSAAFIIGIAGNVDSFSNWTLLGGLAVVPPLTLMGRWNAPRQTMSEAIQKALR